MPIYDIPDPMNPQAAPLASIEVPEGASPQQMQEFALQAFKQLEAASPEMAQQIQAASGMPPRSVEATASGLATAVPATAQALGEAGVEFAKEEALPLALETGAAAAIPGVGPAAALGRFAAVGTASILGRLATRKLRGQPPPTGGELLFEFGTAGGGELLSQAFLDPSEARYLVDSFARKTTRRGVDPVTVGEAFKREAFTLRNKVAKERDVLFDASRKAADRIGLEAPLSGEITATGPAILQLISKIPEVKGGEAKAILQSILKKQAAGEPVTFTDLSLLHRSLASLRPDYSAALKARQLPKNAVRDFDKLVKTEMKRLAKGTLVERPLAKAEDYLQTEYIPILQAIRSAGSDTAAAEDVVMLLSTKPSRLAKVMKNVDPAMADDLRAAWFSTLLSRSSGFDELPDLKKVVATFDAINEKTLNIMAGGNQKSVRKMLIRMQDYAESQAFKQRFHLAQTATMAVAGGAMYSALNDGDIAGPAMLFMGTAAGITLMSRIATNSRALKLFNKGLEVKGRVGGRFIIQALEEVGIHYVQSLDKTPRPARLPQGVPITGATGPGQVFPARP